MKAFVLMEKGYEYDDNYYNPVDGGTPKKIFFDKEQAEIEKTNQNIKRFKEQSFRDYCYGEYDDFIVDRERFEKFNKNLLEKYGTPKFQSSWQRLEEYQLHPNANEEESEEFVSMVQFTFYEINEVDVDKSSFRTHQIQSVLD